MTPYLMRAAASVSVAALAAVGLAFAAAPAASQEASYEGETIKVIIRSGPGGGNDFYGRLLARHMPKYLPGNPDSIAVNMPGGGGIVAANYLNTRAKRDGTEFGIMSRDIAIAQRLKAKGVRYDVRELIALGSASSATFVWVVRGDHPVNDLKDLKGYGKTVKFSGTGAGTGSVQKIKLLANDGFPVSVITGYEGTAEKVIAIARGEVDGTTGGYGSLLAGIREQNLKVIGRMGKHPDLMNVSAARDVMSKDGRALASLMEAPLVAGRPFHAAPEVPKARVTLLRAAFKQALEDKDLLREAGRAKREIGYTSPTDMEEIYEDILNASDKVIADFKGL